MSVFKRKTSSGESNFYHYKFMSAGKTYYGVCEGCVLKKDAEAYEKGIKEKVRDLKKQKNVRALVENYRKELSGGNDILLSEAIDLALKKPRRRVPGKKAVNAKRSHWRDFIGFMNDKYPECVNLADIYLKHAEEYIQYIRDNGRYNKDIVFVTEHGKEATYTNPAVNLSTRVCNLIHSTLIEVYEKLMFDIGALHNPFKQVPKLKLKAESKENFTEEELKLIWNNADDFLRPIFTIGAFTAFREGDICTLKWDEVNIEDGYIRRIMLKTGHVVEVPIIPPLMTHLRELREKAGDSKYVLPDQAGVYLNTANGITYRVKNFLEGIGIVTTKKVKDRSRAVSIKDVHSLRHTFCYYAGVYGVPLLVVKSIVGHMTTGMTELYQRHADLKLKREMMMLMPDLFTGDSLNGNDQERQQLVRLAKTLPIETIREIINKYS